MSLSSSESRCELRSNNRLTIRSLTMFSLPLALTFLMMSGSAPIVSNGITWMQGAEGERVHLAAFLMTFVTALFIYSPMFVARNVAIRTITDRRSMGRYLLFFIPCALISSVTLVLVSQADAIGHLIFGIFMRTDEESERLAREGILIFTPLPILITLRGMGQGCHISNGQSNHVGFGTGLRFTSMITFVFGFGIHSNMSGPVLGGSAYLIGIAAETVYVLFALQNKPQWREVGAGPILTMRQFGQYTFPLIVGSFANQLTAPLLIHLIHKARDPGPNAATFDLIRDTAWMLFSMLMTVQPAVVAHANSRHNLRILLRFAALLLLGITAITAIVALTPVRQALFEGWLEVDNERILQLTYVSLLWLLPLPLVTVANHFTQALHIRSGRTTWITAGNLGGLTLLLLASGFMNFGAYDGVLVAVIGGGLYQLVVSLVQATGLLRGGLAASISPRSLAEHMNGQPSISAHEPGVEPVPEEVRA